MFGSPQRLPLVRPLPTASQRQLQFSGGGSCLDNVRRGKIPRWCWALAALAWIGGALLWVSSSSTHERGGVLGQAHRKFAAGALQDRTAEMRAGEVKAAMIHAWRGYKTYAWGADELHPVSQTPKADIKGGGGGLAGMGVTIVDSLSTLHLMGLHDDFEQARSWVAANLTFEHHTTASFFEVVIRLLGGLLSAHDLSGDPAMLDKAEDLADRLLPAFAGVNGLVVNGIELPRPASARTSDPNVIIAEFGTATLEFGALARALRDPLYQRRAEQGPRFVHGANPSTFLLPVAVNRATGRPSSDTTSLGPMADSYYEYLLKTWLLGAKQDDHWRQRWVGAVEEVMEKLTEHPSRFPFSYVTNLRGAFPDHRLHHLACFWPGSVALGVLSGAVHGAQAARFMEHAAGVMHGCFQLYNATTTGLGADEVEFDHDTGEVLVRDSHYFMRPEVVESLFYLYRATKDNRYREWGWQMFSAVQKHCRQPGGYAGVLNVMQDPPDLEDATQSWFYAETLKYFWLLQSPDSALDLSQWVLNTEAHPLRIAKLPLTTATMS